MLFSDISLNRSRGVISVVPESHRHRKALHMDLLRQFWMRYESACKCNNKNVQFTVASDSELSSFEERCFFIDHSVYSRRGSLTEV